MQSHKVFTPFEHKSLRLRNRIAMAPMTRRMVKDDGIPTKDVIEYYRQRAQGEVGLIISEGTPIDGLHACDTLTVPRFETLDQLEGWKKVVQAVHEEGGAFAPQIWHTGRFGADPIGPSNHQLPPRADGSERPPVKAMTEENFAQVTKAYAKAALSAKEIGCDTIEIHGAHGYLLDSFLSLSNNKRDDQYGGSWKNRMRFPLEVVRAIRQAVGEDYPIIYRFSQWQVDNYAEIKFHRPEELELWVKELVQAGVDILHASTYDALEPAFPDVSEETLSGWTRRLSGVPCIAVGKVCSNFTLRGAYGEEKDAVADPHPAMDLVEKGEADLLALGRTLIANPDWVKQVREGNWQDLKAFDKSMLKTLV